MDVHGEHNPHEVINEVGEDFQFPLVEEMGESVPHKTLEGSVEEKHLKLTLCGGIELEVHLKIFRDVLENTHEIPEKLTNLSEQQPHPDTISTTSRSFGSIELYQPNC
jgi:hypothetical protein